MADPDQKFDRKAAARYLGVSDRTLENWAVRGGGPMFIKASNRPGSRRGRCVYRRRDLDAWLTAREYTSTSDRGNAAK